MTHVVISFDPSAVAVEAAKKDFHDSSSVTVKLTTSKTHIALSSKVSDHSCPRLRASTEQCVKDIK